MKLGIVSFAHMHAYSYADILMELPSVELRAIYDDQVERGQAAARKYETTYYDQYDQFLAQDLDAVIICSENNRHKEHVLQAARAKKHILCEKPIATNIQDAHEMIKQCDQEGVIFQIAYPVRFSTPIRQLKEKIDRGYFGDILAFRTTNRGQRPTGWFLDQEQAGGGAVLDHTVHMVDIMRWFLKEEVVEVTALVDQHRKSSIDDVGLLTLEFSNGTIASHDASWSRLDQYPTWGDVTIEVIGTKRSEKVDAFKEHFTLYQAKSSQAVEQVFFGNDMNYGLINDFIMTVRTGRQASITGYDGLKSLEVALAAYESENLQAPVRLDQ